MSLKSKVLIAVFISVVCSFWIGFQLRSYQTPTQGNITSQDFQPNITYDTEANSIIKYDEKDNINLYEKDIEYIALHRANGTTMVFPFALICDSLEDLGRCED